MSAQTDQTLQQVRELVQKLEPLSTTDRRDALVRLSEKGENTQAIYWALYYYAYYSRFALPKAPDPLSPELREWALRMATAEEVTTGLKEVQEKGGVEFGDVMMKLKEKQEARERAKS